MRCFYLIISLLVTGQYASAQELTGVWEGVMNGDELLQIHIRQKNKELCGFTHDHVLKDVNDHCVAGFNGYYNQRKGLWQLSATYFIENSGMPQLMLIQLWKEPGDAPDIVRARATVKTFLGFAFRSGPDIMLRRISMEPDLRILPLPCFPEEKKYEQEDSLLNDIPTAIVVATDSPGIKNSMMARKQTEQSRVRINADKINLKIYDNGVTDNDTVSVFYNGKLLLSHQRLSEKAIEIMVVLDQKTAIHEIVLYAENLGGIPPNTALVVVTAGDKRYELRSKASLEENAVLVFERVNE